MPPSAKQARLLTLYAEMAREGYATTGGLHIDNAFNDMEIRAFRDHLLPLFRRFGVTSLLDYGCGGSDYDRPGFSEDGRSARQFFGLTRIDRFEPARGLDQRRPADAVVCFDVLEHVFLADLPATVRELFSLAGRLLAVNVACYPARALLPNGENAHVTVRPPLWWKGLFDAIAAEFPTVSVLLLCSTGWHQVQGFPLWSAQDWLDHPDFVIAG